jgi:hypothetical protein
LDVAGAQAYGFPAAWINRGGMPDEYAELAPDLVARDLTGLLTHFAPNSRHGAFHLRRIAHPHSFRESSACASLPRASRLPAQRWEGLK